MLDFNHIQVNIRSVPRVAQHIVEARRQRVADLLRTHRYLGVGEVAERLGVSENTARRDLAALADRDEVQRTFGGAVAAYDRQFASFGDRLQRNVIGKRAVAAAAVKLIEPGFRVFLDAGTTLALVADHLANRMPADTAIYTHSIAVAERLGGAGMDVRVLGGKWLPRQAAVLDERTIDEAGAFEYDLALLGAEAFDRLGAWNSDDSVVALQRRVRLLAGRTVLCADASKLGKQAPAQLAAWRQIDHLVTDASPAALERESIYLSSKQVVRARRRKAPT